MNPNNFVTNLAHALKPISIAMGGAHRTLAVTGTAVATTSVTLSTYNRYVQVLVDTAPVRLTVNGTTPTATLGLRLGTAQSVIMSTAEWNAAQFIAETATSATLQIAEYTL